MGNCVSACAKDQNPVHAITAESSNGGSSKMTNNSSSRTSTFTGDSYNPSQDVSGSLGDTNSSTLHSFTFGDVKAATRNFRPESVLGEGGFGSVFKGWIDEQSFKPAKPGLGTVIAVKKLNDDSLQGHKEWLAEVRILSQLHHPNLVKLIGYCAEDDHRLLIYEFMPRGSLENHLFRGGIHIHPLSWALRMKIAWGTSKGLAFLHDAGVIYRDLKTSNILLDPEFNAKLSDFGLAKDAPIGDNTHVSTCVMGTHGYAAPEYIATGHLTVKSDVYSFGVFLLEILTGRRAVDSTRPIGEQNVVEWVRYLMDTRKIYRVIDPRLDGQYSMKGAQSALSLALNCLNSESKLRPQIKDVVDVLESLVNGRETTKSRSKPSCSDLARGADRSTQKGHFVPSNGASHQ